MYPTSLELADVILTDLLLDILHCTPGIKTLNVFTRGWESGYDRVFKALIHCLILHPTSQQSFLPLLSDLSITVSDVFLRFRLSTRSGLR